jgi:hypothetical protein
MRLQKNGVARRRTTPSKVSLEIEAAGFDMIAQA